MFSFIAEGYTGTSVWNKFQRSGCCSCTLKWSKFVNMTLIVLMNPGLEYIHVCEFSPKLLHPSILILTLW